MGGFLYTTYMPHIHTEPGQHDHTISIYLIRTDLDEPKVLLHLHRKIGKYAQFGGHIELNETPWQAAAHELKEESGYSLSEVRILQPKNRMKYMTGAVMHPQPFAHSTIKYPNFYTHAHIDIMYAFITEDEPADTPSEDESSDLRLFSKKQLIEEANVDPMTRDAALYALDVVLRKWATIPTSEFQL